MNLFPEKYLFEEIKLKAYELGITKLKLSDYGYITDNLRFPLFKWQEDALLNFLTYEAIKEAEEDSGATHLLFNMATGAGKTLVMAATILYYYKKDYRHFIFFVNQNNIVGKTEENLCNTAHSKYLFQKNIVIDDRLVNIRQVNTFDDFSDDIQIKFTSIHTLHNDVYKVKEDSVFLEDLQKRKIVMLADEAHHLNADTKKAKINQLDFFGANELKQNAGQDEIEKSWENTVIHLLLHRGKPNQQHNENVLLEFTATIPEHKEILAKYFRKTIIKFDLKDFLKAGYTKEINLVSSSFDKTKRILQALLFNWYRHKIALKYNIPHFKPVILFRSKTIDVADSNNSKEDYIFFRNLVENLSVVDFDFLKEIDEHKFMDITETYQKGQSRIIDVKRYLAENSLQIREIIDYIQYHFAEHNCIITNSKTNKSKKEQTDAETERLLNSLEDKENHVRAIFTVQRLTEGWDVQNLYDIVRLYEGQNTGGSNKGKTGGATTSEVQLIGRGVRYYPFEYENKERNCRKFDNDLNHELRVLEEFYFHSDNDERYLSELKKELKDKEWLSDNKKLKTFKVKQPFLKEPAYQNIFVNTRLDNPKRKKSTLEEIRKDFNFEYRVGAFNLNETALNLELGETDKTKYATVASELGTLKMKLKEFDLHLIRKAINKVSVKENAVFRFQNLKNELNINSLDDILKEEFLGAFPLNLKLPVELYSQILEAKKDLSIIEADELLRILMRFFEKIASELKLISNPYIGSEFGQISLEKVFGTPKTKSIIEDERNKALESLIKEKHWYVLDGFHGTTEEQSLIEFLSGIIGNFESQYEKVSLLRNEEVYKIYDFEQGRGFMPDFLLFLKEKEKNLHYQIFIEPKGDQFKDAQGDFFGSKEGWKEVFLRQISEKYGNEEIIKAENKDFKLFGLPLYNKKNETSFYSELEVTLEL
ncbi:type III restriction endonuclease [Lacihabitans sp. CCS-44]|uniref:DEAD/DEAH box helicase family protein n=1 Tax=Lacihabitans sp. CCS-44 TaxID=2487331 RepID=UPI0020CD88B8|nr:DEAD/DEAH box helicase family protein [Lacihabitans sp. CCS-44]MCP9757324.1 type III restriction endonuclease [Lacihabitans sp. CCS-44]